MDYDGKRKILRIIDVSCLNDLENSIVIYFNPTSKDFTIEFYGDKSSSEEVQAGKTAGITMVSKEAVVQSRKNVIDLRTEN